MTFTFLDVILLLVVFGFLMFGLWFGFIHTLGSLVGTIIGAVVAARFYTVVPGTAGPIVTFITIFMAISRLTGYIFSLLDSVFHIFSIVPFLKSINRLGGGIFGLLEGVLVVGTVLMVASRYNLGPWFTTSLTSSKVAPPIVDAAKVLLPFLPLALQRVQTFIPWLKF